MTLKERIAADHPLHIGLISVESTRADIETALADQDWDLAFVDLQHTPYTEPQLAAFLRSATALDLPIMLRIPHPDATWQISRLLDVGAAAVLVPMVREAQTVREAIEHVYYPPVGKRSCGLARALGYDPSQTPRAYADWWNANGILAIQVETVEAVLHIDELLLPGVDLILFGGEDLAFSLAATPECPFDSVEACINHVAERARNAPTRVCVSTVPFGRF